MAEQPSFSPQHFSPVKFWAQHVLPIVYDDSLSYYEILNKLVNTLNGFVDNINTTNDTMKTVVNFVNQFYTDITAQQNAFENKINNDFSTLSQRLNNDIEAWENENAGKLQAQYDTFLQNYQKQFGVVQTTGDSTTDVMSQDAIRNFTLHSERIIITNETLSEYNDANSFPDNVFLEIGADASKPENIANLPEYNQPAYIITLNDIPGSNFKLQLYFGARTPDDPTMYVRWEYESGWKGWGLMNPYTPAMLEDWGTSQLNGINQYTLSRLAVHSARIIITNETLSEYNDANSFPDNVFLEISADASKPENIANLPEYNQPAYIITLNDIPGSNFKLQLYFGARTPDDPTMYVRWEYESGWKGWGLMNKPFPKPVVKSNIEKAVSEITLPAVHQSRVYACSFKFTSFNEMTLGRTDNSPGSGYIKVDNKNITTHDYYENEHSYAHGLTLSEYIKMYVFFDKNETPTVTLISGNSQFTITMTTYVDWSNTRNLVIDGDASEIEFNCNLFDLYNDIWVIGDSYISNLNSAMWTSHIMEHNVKNYALIGIAGNSSSVGYYNIELALKYYTPKTIVWCMGMNDGSDTDVPSAVWTSNLDKVKQLCEDKEITLILATIPTTPKVNNNKKNESIRKSGYRYIDFAKAVNANEQGEWYPNLLSSDEIHPTKIGGYALFNQVLIDAPDLFMY